MKLVRFGAIVSALSLSAGVAFAQSSNPPSSSQRSALKQYQEVLQLTTPAPTDPSGRLQEPTRQVAGGLNGNAGALPEPTQAETAQKAQESLQQRLTDVAQAIASLEKRVDLMRRQPEAPPRWDIERVDEDLNLLTEELGKLTGTGLSPLAELQRNDFRDRLFEIQVSLEIAKRRWGGGWNVFGSDFFANAPAVPSVEQRPAPANYKLRIGDKLRVMVISSLGQQTDYHPQVDTSGRLYVPGAGSVAASEKTAAQLKQALNAKITSKFKQLQVEVSVEAMSTMLVQVTGDVARPGACTLTGMATVMSALYQTGGPTKAGSFRQVKLIREGEPSRTIDLYDFLINGNRKQDAPLKDGDLVLVPPVGGTIVIDGDVVRPARYEPSFPITLGAALKMAGGVKPTGYLQTVQVERVENNAYRVLVDEPFKSADGKSSFQLRPGDQVTVRSVRPDRTNQVSVTGPVRVPGIYGLTDGMRVADLVKVAQGLDPAVEVFGGRADILRMEPGAGSRVVSISLDRALNGDPDQNVQLRKLDQVFLYEPDQVVFRPRLVTIQGSVAKPGTYRRAQGMRVSDAVAAAGGSLPEAYMSRADIHRHRPDGSMELIRVELQSAMSGDVTANVELQDRDEVTVYNCADVTWTSRQVRIEGAVQRQGVYSRPENMRISDLVFASGGLLPEAAGVVEVARCREGGLSDITKVDLASLKLGSESDILLEDRDVVTVPALNPFLRSSEVVFITGEVKYPGPYTLNRRDETITDLLERAGGLTQYANLDGALFLRQKESFENSQQERDVDLILEKSRAFADKQFLTLLAKMGVGLPGQFVQAVQESAEKLAKPSEVVVEEKLSKNVNELATAESGTTGTIELPAWKKSGVMTPQEASATPDHEDVEESATASAMGPRVARSDQSTQAGFEGRQELALLANSARVSVDLRKALVDPHSADNVQMRQGDQVFIPRQTNIVTVIGAVLHPHSFAASRGKSVDYYIGLSGGFAQDAAKGNVVVIRSNGDALPKDQVKSVEPGDTIAVPNTGLIDIAKKWERVGSVTKVFSDILSSAYILTKF